MCLHLVVNHQNVYQFANELNVLTQLTQTHIDATTRLCFSSLEQEPTQAWFLSLVIIFPASILYEFRAIFSKTQSKSSENLPVDTGLIFDSKIEHQTTSNLKENTG